MCSVQWEGGGVDTMSTTEGYHDYSGGVQYSGEIP